MNKNDLEETIVEFIDKYFPQLNATLGKVEEMYYVAIKPIEKVKKIYDYIKILWHDEDWDFSYLLTLIEYKIKRMRKCLRENSVIYEPELNKILESMDKTLKHIDNYFNAEDFVGDEKTGGAITPSITNDGIIWLDEDGEQVEDDIVRALIINRDKYAQEELESFFNSMRDNCQTWWD